MDADRLAAHLELAQMSEEDFVRAAYRLLLRRDPEPEALARRVPRATLLRELVASPEFDAVAAVDDALARASAEPRFLEAPAALDERAIEIPWALARYHGERRVLDVGTANAEPAYVAAIATLEEADVVGVDLVEARVPGIRSVVGDVRSLPFEASSFDLAFCVSTLEHVGRDNTRYGSDGGAGGGIDDALAELRRVLSPTGRLLVTVPCGEFQDHGWFVQLEPRGWNDLFLSAGFGVAEEEVYACGPGGWRIADPFDPRGVRYDEDGRSAAAVLCAELSPRSAVRRVMSRLRRSRAASSRRGGA